MTGTSAATLTAGRPGHPGRRLLSPGRSGPVRGAAPVQLPSASGDTSFTSVIILIIVNVSRIENLVARLGPMASADLLLHPVRLRIIKAFLGDRALTTTQLAAELDDVPAGSVYRHVARLAREGVLQV